MTQDVYTAEEAAAIEAFKAAQAGRGESREAWEYGSPASLQDMIDSGTWGLEGSAGRAMMRAIESGECILGPAPARDYYGNRIPAEYEVEDGTKGSLQYALARGEV